MTIISHKLHPDDAQFKMGNKTFIRSATMLLLAGLLFAVPVNFQAEPASALQPNIGVNGFFSVDKAQRGRTIQAAVVVSVPSGFHINSNRPAAKFLIPTSLRIEASSGIRVGAVSYPRALVRRFAFSEDPMSVYEGRAVLRFNITVPANFSTGVTQLRARVKYQSCNEEACFPPVTRQVTMPIAVVDTNESVKRINRNIFGGGRRRG